MSYSGFTERLCLKGHYSAVDVWCEKPEVCDDCGAAHRFFHGVDETNGYDESHPSSCRAPKIEVGHEDVWHEDHLGNRYATKLRQFAPAGEHWVKVNSRGNATPPYEDDLASCDTHPKDGDVEQAPLVSGAVTNEVRQTPKD